MPWHAKRAPGASDRANESAMDHGRRPWSARCRVGWWGACGWGSGRPAPSGQNTSPWARWENEAPATRAARSSSQAQPVRRAPGTRRWRRRSAWSWATRNKSMRSGGGHERYVARSWPCDVNRQGADVPVCLERSGGRLAGGWLGQSFDQRPDLGIGIASVTTQGTEVGQPALLGPATHRLWRHVKELGDLRCTEVPRLGWLWHRTLHSWASVPHMGDNPISIRSNRHPAFYTASQPPSDHR